MTKKTRSGNRSERPWLDRMKMPDPPPPSLAEAEREITRLSEIQAHREWVIDGLRDHIANLEAEIARSDQRVQRLEEHTENLEARNEELFAHMSNLEKERTNRENYLSQLEEHVRNLERRIRPRLVDFRCEDILPRSEYPRLEQLFRLGNRIYARRPDLRERFPRNRAADFWYWLMWHGGDGNFEIASERYPLPDEYLRSRVVGEESTEEKYRCSGLVDWWTIDRSLRVGGFDPMAGGRVLDFGVGCGRILQNFSLYAQSCELVGADVDEEAIGWCRKNLDFASFHTLPLSPPSRLPDAHFDAIYAYSVFSHLPLDRHLEWMAELHRIARPGAVVVITLQGCNVVEAILQGNRWTGAFPDAATLRAALPALESEQFAFFPYAQLSHSRPENGDRAEALDADRYGSTFVLEPWIRQHWAQHWELVAYEEAPDNWQDYVVFRRRA